MTRKTVKKNKKSRKTGVIRIVTHEIEDDSFFNYFSSINYENEKMNAATGQALM